MCALQYRYILCSLQCHSYSLLTLHLYTASKRAKRKAHVNMVFSHLEDIKTYFEDNKSDRSPRELHLTKTSQLERQRQKYLKWWKRAEELEGRLETWMETMSSQLELPNQDHHNTEILVEGFKGQHVNLTSDGIKTWRRKQEKEDGEKERNNKKERAAEEKKERKEKKEREAKEKKERKEHERKLKKEKKEREEKERKERKEQKRKEKKQKEHEKKEKKERKQQERKEKKFMQNVCEKKDEEKGEKEAEKKREKKKVTFCERVTVYTFSGVPDPCLCQ
ncbi:uncharacterized protein LOC144040727 [Vanacampus margaritifer]